MAICPKCKTDKKSFREVRTNKGLKEICEDCYNKMVNDFWAKALEGEQKYARKRNR